MDYMGAWGNKDPEEKKAYGIDWTGELNSGDTISTSTWTVVSGTVTLSGQDKTSTQTKTTVDGGVDGEIAYIKNTCVTLGGEKLEGTMRLDIRSR